MNVPSDLELQKIFSDNCIYSGPRKDLAIQRMVQVAGWFAVRYGDHNFMQELTGTPEKYVQRISEILIAHKMRRAGYKIIAKGKGPDFFVEKNGTSFWIEVVCPESKSIPDDYISQVNQSPDGLLAVPWNDILLRWSNSIDQKAKKLLGHHGNDFQGYISKGLVKPEQPYVIAINARQLRGALGIGFNGMSTRPCAVEALFGIGQAILAHVPNLDSTMPTQKKNAELTNLQRTAITKNNGSWVDTTSFFSPEFRAISAVWAMDIDESELLLEPKVHGISRAYWASAGIFNPLAANPISPGSLPTHEDWTCQLNQNNYTLKCDSRIPFPA